MVGSCAREAAAATRAPASTAQSSSSERPMVCDTRTSGASFTATMCRQCSGTSTARGQRGSGGVGKPSAPRKRCLHSVAPSPGPMRTAAYSSRPLLRVRVRTGATMAQAELVVGQATISLPPAKRGFHLITNRVRTQQPRESHERVESHNSDAGRPSGQRRPRQNCCWTLSRVQCVACLRCSHGRP